MSYEVRFQRVDPRRLPPRVGPAILQAVPGRFTAHVDQTQIDPALLTPLSDLATEVMEHLVPREAPLLEPQISARVIRRSGLIVVPQVEVDEKGITWIVPESGMTADLAAVMDRSGTYITRYFDLKLD